MMVYRRQRNKSSKSQASSKSSAARVVIDCSPHRITGGSNIDGLTAGGDVQHESHLEKLAIATLSLCHDVIDFRSQATREPYVVDGKTHEHIPDFTVNTTFAEELQVEVKALSFLMQDRNLEKAANVGRGYRERDKAFSYLVDAQLMQEPLAGNVRLLARYVTSHPKVDVFNKASELLVEGPRRIDTLLNQPGIELVDIYTLIARRLLCVDMLSQDLSSQSSVSLPNTPHKGLSLENLLRSTRHSRLLERLALGYRPSDQQCVAAAKNWRQRRSSDRALNFVVGL